jgi:hypothetical protein
MGHDAFQWRYPSPFVEPETWFCDVKGGCEPTNGETPAAEPQALQALGFPLAKRLSGQLKPDVYNYKCL